MEPGSLSFPHSPRTLAISPPLHSGPRYPRLSLQPQRASLSAHVACPTGERGTACPPTHSSPLLCGLALPQHPAVFSGCSVSAIPSSQKLLWHPRLTLSMPCPLSLPSCPPFPHDHLNANEAPAQTPALTSTHIHTCYPTVLSRVLSRLKSHMVTHVLPLPS